MIELNNKKYEYILSNKFMKLESKFQKIYKSNNIKKLLDLYIYELNKLKNTIIPNNKIKDYIILSSLQYNKLLCEMLICIIKQYITNNNTKPHIIISYNIEINIFNTCKQLLKSNIIELTIISNDNLIIDLKKNKKNNTLIVLINPINNNLVLDITTIYRYCKYYNILLITNLLNELYNYSDSNYLYNNQDIILLNYNKYSILNNKDIIIHYFIIKNKFIDKYHLHEIIKKYENSDNMNNSIKYIINLSDINSKLLDNKLNTVKQLYNYIFDKLRQNYRIVNYYDLITNKNIHNIKYFNNSITIVSLNSVNVKLFNNIYFSIYSPDFNFTNKSLMEYLKLHKINLNIVHKNVLNDNLLTNNYEYNNKLKNGLIHFQINIYTKISELDKLLLCIDSFIHSKILQKNNKTKKIVKNVRFITPEFIICKKIHNPNNKFIRIKSILKKK